MLKFKQFLLKESNYLKYEASMNEEWYKPWTWFTDFSGKKAKQRAEWEAHVQRAQEIAKKFGDQYLNDFAHPIIDENGVVHGFEIRHRKGFDADGYNLLKSGKLAERGRPAFTHIIQPNGEELLIYGDGGYGINTGTPRGNAAGATSHQDSWREWADLNQHEMTVFEEPHTRGIKTMRFKLREPFKLPPGTDMKTIPGLISKESLDIPKTQNMSSGVALDANAPASAGKLSVGSAAKAVGSAIKSPGGAAIIGTVVGELAKPAIEKSGATDWLADKLTPFIPDWALGSSPAEKVRERADQLTQEVELTGGKPLSTIITGPNPISGTQIGDSEEDEQAMKIVRARQQAKQK